MMRRRLTAIAAAFVLVLVAACGSDSDPVGDSDGPPTSAAPGSNGTQTETGDPEGSGDGGTTAAPGDSTPGSSGADPTSPEPTSSPSTTGFSALDGTVPVGMFAPSLLRPDGSERLVVEIQADQAPQATTVDHLRAALAEVSAKPVEVVEGTAPGGGDRNWDAASLRQTADRGAVLSQGDGVAVVRMLFVHGSLEGDDGTLGVAVRGDIAAVFVDRVADAAGVIGSPAAIERAVATHELGHLLGLVDLYLDSGREDPEHPGHSTNRDSVMYWAVESDLIGQLLGANPPDTFDSADRADLDAIRGGA